MADAQTGVEVIYQILISSLTGADLVHDVGLVYHATTISPELIVFVDEIIDMVKVLMCGIEINDETFPLVFIEKLRSKSNYPSESHTTMKHFRKFWGPKIFDRSFIKKEGVKEFEELLNQRTIEIIKTHKPKPLPEDVVRNLKKVEKTRFGRFGLKHEYPKREQM